MPTHEVEAVEAACNQHVDGGQPKIFEGASARVHGGGKGLTVGADAVRHNRQCVGPRRDFFNRPFGDGVNDDRIYREGQMIGMLFSVSNGKSG